MDVFCTTDSIGFFFHAQLGAGCAKRVSQLKQYSTCYQIQLYLIISEFSNERLRVERRANFHKTRSKNIFNESLNRYLTWITQAGDF